MCSVFKTQACVAKNDFPRLGGKAMQIVLTPSMGRKESSVTLLSS
ncbi:MAG: hypothetical protein OJF48_003325 [Afipia sp.]|nr:MAG: hypothetical protein OJF48_003325 [Afipia sp.]